MTDDRHIHTTIAGPVAATELAEKFDCKITGTDLPDPGGLRFFCGCIDGGPYQKYPLSIVIQCADLIFGDLSVIQSKNPLVYYACEGIMNTEFSITIDIEKLLIPSNHIPVVFFVNPDRKL